MDIVLNKGDKLTLTINNLTNSAISIPEFPTVLEEGSTLFWNIIGAINEPTGEEPTGPTGPEPTEPSEPSDSVRSLLNTCLSKFNNQITVNTNSTTYNYLLSVASEAYSQYYNNTSENNLPLFVTQDNFPNFIDYYGNRGDESSAFMTMLGTICSSLLSELYPTKRNQLLKIGYNAGGYTMSSNAYVYGWKFRCDPNIMRIIGASILASMHGKTSNISTKINTMRSEVGGTVYDRNIITMVNDETKMQVKDNQFFIDFRNFMNSAPGPYAPGYTDRTHLNPTFSDSKSSNLALQIDMNAYNYAVTNYNLNTSNSANKQKTVQAIADKDMIEAHLYGNDTRGLKGKYDFNAVFGQSTIGFIINTNSNLNNFFNHIMTAGTRSRGILQHADNNFAAYGYKQYGRLRPGCSEQKEGKRKSYSDNRYNVLVNFDIEDGDGNKETYWDSVRQIYAYYYDENGNWTNSSVQSAEDYANIEMDALYANSYPSGHSSGIMCIALTLMQKYPNKANLILKAANNFAINRVIARYHWLSDTIQGRVVGALMSPIVRATKDYYTLFNTLTSSI